MAEHTKGEWKTGVGFHGHWPIYVMKGGSTLIGLTLNDGLDGDKGHWEAEFNAMLMSAAPELLESNINLVAYAKTMLALHPDDPTLRALVDMGNEAIAKAKGE